MGLHSPVLSSAKDIQAGEESPRLAYLQEGALTQYKKRVQDRPSISWVAFSWRPGGPSRSGGPGRRGRPDDVLQLQQCTGPSA